MQELKENCLYGVDAGEDQLAVARIARINMYLHQDGGSRIYQNDFLDKEIRIEQGIPRELKNEFEELRNKLTKEHVLFDVVVSNPPFGMNYKSSRPDQAEIMKQYQIAFAQSRTNTKLATSLRSSVMSLERYYDLLKPGVKLLTVMDESILNTDSKQYVRKYIQENFIIRAVVSLPRNTFINTESAVKTSVLYLIKKCSSDEDQPPIFMAISSNVGHGDTGKPADSI
jgi:type I restriction enzyme M protein